MAWREPASSGRRTSSPAFGARPFSVSSLPERCLPSFVMPFRHWWEMMSETGYPWRA